MTKNNKGSIDGLLFQCFELQCACTYFSQSKHCASPACQLNSFVIKKDNHGDKSESKSGIELGKGLKWQCYDCEFLEIWE